MGNEAQIPPKDGYVYFLSDGEAVKIGYSKTPHRRIFRVRQSHHKQLKLLGQFPGSMATERRLHDRFDHLRLHGEWFRMTDEITEYVNDLNSGYEIEENPIARDNPTCIPKVPAVFKDWADRSCCAWPPELQVLAYRAWLGLRQSDETEFQKFVAAYGQ